MQEISINLPIIFQILSLTEELSWENKMRLNIEKNNAFVKIVKLAILFAGIVKYCLQFALEEVETFAVLYKLINIFTENTGKQFLLYRLQVLKNLPK